MVDPVISQKRRQAGRKGAAARWGSAKSDGKNGKIGNGDGKPWLKTTRPIAKLREGRNDWYRIENKIANATAEVFIYDEIGYFGVTAADFVNELRDIDADTIELHLNTPGGDVFDGIAIYNALVEHAAEVTVIVDSLAASAGSFIAQAGDTISMTRNATLMIHDAWGLAIGNAADMREMAELLDKLSNNIADIYAERSGGTIDQWRDLMRAETWFSADEAVEAGLADEVRGRASTGKNSFDLSVFTYAGRDRAPTPAIPSPAAQSQPAIDFAGITKSLEEAFA